MSTKNEQNQKETQKPVKQKQPADTSSKKKQGNNNNEDAEEIVDINYYDILAVASGLDNDGFPRSGATLTVEKVTQEDETQHIIDTAPMDCEFQIYSEGGAVVLQCDFTGQKVPEQRQILDICQRYMERKNDNLKNGEVLSIVLVPIPLQGNISLLFQGLTYYTGIDMGASRRLILVFDNLLTNVYQTDDIDMKEIQMTVEAEIKRQQDTLDQELYEAEQELKNLEAENQYAAMVKDKYTNMQPEKVQKKDENEDDEQQDTDNDKKKKKNRGDSLWED